MVFDKKVTILAFIILGFLTTCEGQGALPPGMTVVSCGEFDYIEPGGDISINSQDYPKNYANNLHCFWLIQCSKAGAPLTVRIDDFDVVATPDCKNDSLLMRDGSRSNSTILAHLCGKNIVRKDYVTSGNQLRVEFNTDSKDVAKGFKATVKCLKNETTPSTMTPPTTSPGQLPPGSTVVSCGEFDYIMPGSGIDVGSSGYPKTYNKMERCRWAIQCSNPNQSLIVTFKDSELEQSTNCSKDLLLMRDGFRSNSTLLLHTCGKIAAGKKITTSTGFLRVEFDTNDKVEMKGWSANVYCPDKSTTVKPTTPQATTTPPPITLPPALTSTQATPKATTPKGTTPKATTSAPPSVWKALEVCGGSVNSPTVFVLVSAMTVCSYLKFDFTR